MDQLIESVIRICRKNFKDRSKGDLKFLMDITSGSKIFQDLHELEGELAHEIACKYLLYEFCDTDSYLFRYGEVATNFYVIVSGRVGVEVPVDDKMEEILEYTDGEAFGELAIENNKPRQASIRCKTPCHFVYLEKSDYKRTLSSILTEKQNKMISFLHSLPVFSHFTKGTLLKLTYNFSERNYSAKTVVYRESQSPEEFYIIVKGQFNFYKKIVVQKKKVNRRRLENKKMNQGQVLILGPGEIFGEEEIVNSCPRKYTCVCAESALVLVISRTVSSIQNFLKRIRGEESLKVIRERINDRNSEISKRINTWQAIEEYSSFLFAPRVKDKLTPIKKKRKTIFFSRPPDAPTRALKRKLGNALSYIPSRYVSPVTSEPVTTRSSRTDLLRKKLMKANRSTKHSPEIRDMISQKLKERSISISSINSYPIYCALWKYPL